MAASSQVRIVEVGPRDGLQNEKLTTSVEFRVELVNRLHQCGLKTIEAGSFVSPKWVPQMQDTDKVLDSIERTNETKFIVLVPNLHGMKKAVQAKADEIAIFSAATETFCWKNINCSIADSFSRFQPVVDLAQSKGISVRGYVSCVLGCPYEGSVLPEQVLAVVDQLFKVGCYEVSLGDTIGVGTVAATKNLIKAVTNFFPVDSIAVHFHDTYGQALPNILTALELGVSVVDSAISGLGGCPYAKGASGNVATDDVIYMLDRMGIETGVDLNALVETSNFISQYFDRPPVSRVARARLHL